MGILTPPMDAADLGAKRRKALESWPFEACQRISNKQARLQRHSRTRPPGFTRVARFKATEARSSRQLRPEKLEKAPSKRGRSARRSRSSVARRRNSSLAESRVKRLWCLAT